MGEEAISATILSLPSHLEKVPNANINLRRTGPAYRERMPTINAVTSPKCSFLSLAGKVSHVMTTVMINQLFLRNLRILPHLS